MEKVPFTISGWLTVYLICLVGCNIVTLFSLFCMLLRFIEFLFFLFSALYYSPFQSLSIITLIQQTKLLLVFGLEQIGVCSWYILEKLLDLCLFVLVL